MLHLSARSRLPDLATAGWLMSSCWMCASYGCSIVQMWLLSQGWQIFHAAFLPATLFALWIAGTLVAPYRHLFWTILGAGGALSLLLANANHSLVLFSGGLHSSTQMQHSLLWGLLTLCCGASFQRWLGKSRSGWPEISEHPRLMRQWSALTVGLVVVWWKPLAPWSLLLAAVLLLPLFVLDLCRWSPLPVASRPFLYRHTWQAQHPATWQLDLDIHDLPRGWVWSWLSTRGLLALSLLATGVNVVLTLVWSSIATPFAAAVGPKSLLLVWLTLAQFTVLLVGCLLARICLRGLVGKPYRMLSPKLLGIAEKILLLLLLGLSSSLILFGSGLPLSWPVTIVFTAYTVCGAFWSQLLPRLMPTREMVARQTPFSLSLWRLPWEWPEQQVALAVERALEGAVAQHLERLGALFILIGLPVCGWFIDQTGTHLLFLLAGPLLLLFSITYGLVSRKQEYALLSQATRQQDQSRRTKRLCWQDTGGP